MFKKIKYKENILKAAREKQIPYANTYIWNIKKNGSEEPSSRTGIKVQM